MGAISVIILNEMTGLDLPSSAQWEFHQEAAPIHICAPHEDFQAKTGGKDTKNRQSRCQTNQQTPLKQKQATLYQPISRGKGRISRCHLHDLRFTDRGRNLSDAQKNKKVKIPKACDKLCAEQNLLVDAVLWRARANFHAHQGTVGRSAPSKQTRVGSD